MGPTSVTACLNKRSELLLRLLSARERAGTQASATSNSYARLSVLILASETNSTTARNANAFGLSSSPLDRHSRAWKLRALVQQG